MHMATGIYIHIPYCRGKCVYCDFYSVPSRRGMETVAEGISSELRAALAARGTEPVSTVYIGGGTPSVMPPQLLAMIVREIPAGAIEEFTVEANPDDVTPQWVEAMREMGVDRVSMGVQSLDDTVLRRIGRRHTAQQARRAVDTLLDGGISNVSCDLIYGLPGQSAREWEDDLRRILEWPLCHLSAYCLTWAVGTPLYRMMLAGKVRPADDADLAERYALLERLTAGAGYEHYEISNFARPGYRSRHNSLYWARDGRWIGVGPAAHSFDGAVRRANPCEIATWAARLPYPGEAEDESALDRINDRIVSALRTAEGLDLDEMPAVARDALSAAAARFVDAGLATMAHGRMAIPSVHWFISDSIIRELLIERL